MELWLALTILGGSSGALGYGTYKLNSYLNKIVKKSYEEVSDADIIRLIGRHSGMFKSSDLRRLTGLKSTAAYMRLTNLSTYGLLKTIYDNYGRYGYTLKDDTFLDLPTKRKAVEDITEDDILDLAADCMGFISPAAVCLAFDLTYKEAKKVIKKMRKLGVIDSQYNNYLEREYRIAKHLQRLPKSERKQIRSGEAHMPAEFKKNISDADIIRAAVNRGGILTPTALCLDRDIPYDTAEELMNELQLKGVFELIVNEHSGALEYHLNDKSLINKPDEM